MKAYLSALLLAVLCAAGSAQAHGGPHGGGPGGGGGHAMGPGGGHGPGGGGHFGPGPRGGHFGPGPGPGPHHWGGGWGPGFYDDWDFLWLAGATAYLYDSPYYYGYTAPAVVYTPAYSSDPTPATPIAAAPRFSYYCPGRGYYPQVQTCETDFIRKPIP